MQIQDVQGQQSKLLAFLRTDMDVSEEAIAIAMRRTEERANLLPVVLWQYGLITLDQLNKVFDWLETA
ncbi:MAG: DUF2949 domain-containing protein [Elainellaceae cyanobacterium]